MSSTKKNKLSEYSSSFPSEEPLYEVQMGNCQVFLLGTAHVSEKSTNEVERLIQTLKPDTVCVELCQSRKKSIDDPEYWKKQDIFKVFKERKMYLLLSSLILSSFQKKIGNGKIKPGDELRKAISEGEKIGAKIVPIDREIQITLKRAWRNIGFFSKMFLFSALASSLFVKEDVSPEKIEEMKSEDMLQDLFAQLPKQYSHVKEVIIDERDSYLAQNVRNNALHSKKLLAVVGAGHLPGILEHIHDDKSIAHLDEIPVLSLWNRYSFLLAPLFFGSLFALLFYRRGADAGVEFVTSWVVVKSAFAGIGALIALAHPVSTILAMVVAPFGNFNPFIKPGWVAALAESYLRKPLVEDFENIATDSEHWKGYWKNRVIRIFLVLMLPQLGSSIGTFLVTYQGIKNLF